MEASPSWLVLFLLRPWSLHDYHAQTANVWKTQNREGQDVSKERGSSSKRREDVWGRKRASRRVQHTSI